MFGVALLVGNLLALGVSFCFAAQLTLIANRAFTIKMGLVACAGINAALFHARDGLRKLDGWARAQTALSLGLWIAVMICGRWIAYR